MMYISSFIVVWLCVVAELGLAANVPARRERHELTISECAAKGGECDETKGRPVCGTDDQTYPSRCHLLRVQCSGHQVSLKYRGPCKACKEARDYALKHKYRNPPKFIPRCKTDGTYAAVQCLGDTGCWCSDITGKPIENTSVRNGKPKCREYTKANIRRSPPRHLSPSRGRRTCTAIDRATFNANLIKVFQSEYMRAGQQKRGLSANAAAIGGEEGLATPNDKSVIDWKFTYLDANANQMLDKNEFRELKKLVKRAVKPRRCGRAFGKFCDLDDDDRLTLTEWNNCFSKDEINRPDILVDLRPKADIQFNESDSESDCLADQKVALEEQRHGGTLFYVPECTPDGRYQRVQCYRSTPYCWCVHEDTGKNIPGTSVKDKRPQCDAIYAAPRSMKGCPEPRKTIFLNDLKEFLKTDIVPTAMSSANTTKWNSEDERIATLSFVWLDKNKNKAWERKEWKTFREIVTSSKTLRKCGKKMPRYCDVNSDKKITLTEWLNCLQTERIEEQVTSQSSTEANESITSKKLTGSNPLERYLKD
ncbi:SPARC-related modular calcium-binding protein 1 isoform X3 [Anastrepha obliqua]|uniref:SPARC-related modular calcium-binding protein 1 isoform X3 n=1 Tax=Anastrepha obliqua TaxID=95512 RepID=UPI0024099825|nr:SPARC-related modular calcium-binding protein 1 isoform X3 [Anastrepha obliqua]